MTTAKTPATYSAGRALCPCGSAEYVNATVTGGFAATTATLEPCWVCRLLGITSREVRKSYLVEAGEPTIDEIYAWSAS